MGTKLKIERDIDYSKVAHDELEEHFQDLLLKELEKEFGEKYGTCKKVL